MDHHMHHVKKLQEKTTFSKSKEDRVLLVEISMHTSDLNNPTQPWKNSKEWAILVAQEFVAQVEKERELGLPVTAHMDLAGELVADNPAVAKLNLGFINYLVKPLWISFCDFFPNFSYRLGKSPCPFAFRPPRELLIPR